MLRLNLADEQAMESLGGLLAALCPVAVTIDLDGDLGTGKTTLARGFVKALGHTGLVKSPTYTLVEPYILADRTLYHFDLYRLGDPEELEFLGFRDFDDPRATRLVEWPGRGEGVLPPADVTVYLEHHPAGRSVRLDASTELLAELSCRLPALGKGLLGHAQT
jgi:tRNA threonylcarbamoyladenosine biosynthesis protein TsaE